MNRTISVKGNYTGKSTQIEGDEKDYEHPVIQEPKTKIEEMLK